MLGWLKTVAVEFAKAAARELVALLRPKPKPDQTPPATAWTYRDVHTAQEQIHEATSHGKMTGEEARAWNDGNRTKRDSPINSHTPSKRR